MQSPLEYSFDEKLESSRGCRNEIETILRAKLPGASQFLWACKENDKRGIDVWVEMQSGRMVRVDVKLRDDDYLKKKGEDDLAIETFSVVEPPRIGWSRDPNKQTEIVLWYWRDTGRHHMVPFLPLCKATQLHWEEWRATYRTVRQRTTNDNGNGGWLSECVFVPRRIVTRAILDVSCSEPSDAISLVPLATTAADAQQAGKSAEFVMGQWP